MIEMLISPGVMTDFQLIQAVIDAEDAMKQSSNDTDAWYFWFARWWECMAVVQYRAEEYVS